MPLKFVMTGNLRSSNNVGVGSSLHEVYQAANGQTVFTLAGTYTVGTHELFVLLNGMEMEVGKDYRELDEKSIEFLYPLDNTDTVKFRVNEIRNTRMHQEFNAIAGQVEFTLSAPYHVGLNTLQVYDEGMLLRNQADYEEVDEFNVRLLYVPGAGAKITFKEIV